MNCEIEEKLKRLSLDNSRFRANAKEQLSYDAQLLDEQSFLAHQLSSFKKGRILDVGCGYGTLTGF